MKKTEFKYWAFISYSHQDKKWGDWLHRKIETYRIPKSLIGKKTRVGEIPKRLFPVFRDREELPTSNELGKVIDQALRDSSHLIVICSPRSAKSEWVNEEILRFKGLGKSDKILCLIVDGEPNVSDKPDIKADECFPQSVKYDLTEDGELSKIRTEPIAADLREGKDGKANAFLKLISGLLGVGFDELKQRDRSRKRKLFLQLSLFTSLMIAVIGFITLWAYQERQGKVDSMNRIEENNYFSSIRVAQEKIEAGEFRESREILLQTPVHFRNWEWGYLMNLTKPELFSIEGPFDAASFSPDGKFLFFKSKAFDSAKAIGGKVQIFNLAEEKRIEVLIKDKAPYGLSPLHHRFVYLNSDGKLSILNLLTEEVIVVEGHRPVSDFAFSLDGRNFAFVDENRSVHVINLHQGNASIDFKQKQKGPLQGKANIELEFSSDGKICFLTGDGKAKVGLLNTGEIILSVEAQFATFFPDGKSLLVCEGRKTKVWDFELAKWRFQKVSSLLDDRGNDRFARMGDPLISSKNTVTPNGKWIVRDFGTDDDLGYRIGAKVISAKDGTEHPALRNKSYNASSSPDGTKLIAWGWDVQKSINFGFLLDGVSGEILHSFGESFGENESRTLIRLIFSNSGKKLFTLHATEPEWPNDLKGMLWNLENISHTPPLVLNEISLPNRDNPGVFNDWNLSFSPDEESFLVSLVKGKAELFDTMTAQKISVFRGHGGIAYSSFSRGGKMILMTDQDLARAVVWKSVGKGGVLSLPKQTNGVRHAAFSHDGLRVVTTSGNGDVKIWNANEGDEVASLNISKGGGLNWASFSIDGNQVAISSVVNLKIWNLNDMTVRTLRNIKMRALQVSQFHDPNKLLISTTNEMSSAKPRIFEYDLESVNKPAQVLELRNATPVFCIQSSDNGSFFVGGSFDETARIWTAKIWDSSGKLINSLKKHENQILFASFSPDALQVVTASKDHTARLWNAKTGEQLHVLEGHDKPVWSAFFSYDGKRVITGGEDGVAILWDAESGRRVLSLPPIGEPSLLLTSGLRGLPFVPTPIFSSDGSKILAKCPDGTVKIWHADSDWKKSKDGDAKGHSYHFGPELKNILKQDLRIHRKLNN